MATCLQSKVWLFLNRNHLAPYIILHGLLWLHACNLKSGYFSIALVMPSYIILHGLLRPNHYVTKYFEPGKRRNIMPDLIFNISFHLKPTVK